MSGDLHFRVEQSVKSSDFVLNFGKGERVLEARCDWCGEDPLYISYHDAEWGVPQRDGRALWECLMLEGFQAGLSWITILRKRDTFRAAFCDFDPLKVARFDEQDIERLLGDPGIVRHRGKIEGTIKGAQAWIDMGGADAFSDYVWDFVGGSPIQTNPKSMADVPASTPLSTQISKDLKKRGFKFCGPTIVYAWMQAVGLVNDHLVSCPRHAELSS